jgi:hypothetical protein
LGTIDVQALPNTQYMIKSNQNEQLIKIGNWISRRLDKYEGILGSIFFIIIIVKISTELPVNFFITIILETLAILYFLNAFSVLNNQENDAFGLFVYKLSSLGFTMVIIGILFRIQNWPGYSIMLLIGSITMIISLIFFLIIKNKKPQITIFNSRWIIRTLLMAFIGFTLYFTSTDSIVKARLINPIENNIIK